MVDKRIAFASGRALGGHVGGLSKQVGCPVQPSQNEMDTHSALVMLNLILLLMSVYAT